MSEKSNETLKRFILEYHHTQTYAEMVQDDDGDWVRYSDYRALAAIDAAAEITRLRAQLVKADALAERINDWAADGLTDENCRDWLGHVEPALAAYRAAREQAQ